MCSSVAELPEHGVVLLSVGRVHLPKVAVPTVVTQSRRKLTREVVLHVPTGSVSFLHSSVYTTTCIDVFGMNACEWFESIITALYSETLMIILVEAHMDTGLIAAREEEQARDNWCTHSSGTAWVSTT